MNHEIENDAGVGRATGKGPKALALHEFWLQRVLLKLLKRRIEAFNVTNSFRPDTIATQGTSGSGAFLTFGTNTFGQIRKALSPRILQFAVKYMF